MPRQLDGENYAALRAFSDDLVDEGSQILRPEAVRERGWVVAAGPMSELSREASTAIASYAQAHDCGRLEAWFVDDVFVEDRRSWSVEATSDDIDALWDIPGGTLPCYLLTTSQRSFAVLVAQDDFHLIAGPLDFVETVIGGPLADARQAIETASSDWLRGQLRSAWSHYD